MYVALRYLIIAKSLDQLWDVKKNVILYKTRGTHGMTTPYHLNLGYRVFELTGWKLCIALLAN